MKIFKLMLKILFILILLCIIAYTTFILIVRPSNDRPWNDDQSILPYADISATSSLMTIHNIRNFDYASTTIYTRNYYDKTFDVSKLKRVWYIVEPFSGYAGAAHTFLSFEFENNKSSNTGDNSDQENQASSTFLAISVEIRKEKGEKFSAVKGLLRQYEIMYVIADEKDVVKLRSNFRKDQVYVYPVKTTPEKAQLLFTDMINRANELRTKPVFYNTLTNTCTTNIVRHVNRISEGRVPWDPSILFPANSDLHAYNIGLLDTDLPFEQARQKFLINEKALKYADDPNFSSLIRQ